MNHLTTIPAAQLGETARSLHDLLRQEHQHGRLLPWLQKAIRDAFLLDQARALGLSVEPPELQQAADLRRRRLGLLSAEKTRVWLAQRRLTEDDFESALHADLLVAKLKRHVTEKPAAERFQANPGDYDRLRLVLALLPREDLAHEVLSQVAEDGAELSELASRHSRHPSARGGGRVGPLFRRQLPGPLRAPLATARIGAIVGPVADGEGFYLVRLEELAPAELDAATAAFLTTELFDEWLRERLAPAAFSAPLLDALA